MRLIKVLLVLVILGFAGLTGFAYFGDMTPAPAAVSTTLDLNTAPVAPAGSEAPAGNNGN